MASYSVADISVIHAPSCTPELPQANYDGIHEESRLLPAGYRKTPQNRTFDVATMWERDVPLKTREGVTLRADAFRPKSTPPRVPALIA